MSTALLSLAGLFISVYLYLFKIGKIGTLACGTGACETVQLSPWSRVAGIEVSLIGVAGYAILTGLSLAAVQPGLFFRRWPTRLLILLSATGVAFTLYLTYLELFVIHAICRWCVGSGVIIVAILIAALLDRQRLSRARIG